MKAVMLVIGAYVIFLQTIVCIGTETSEQSNDPMQRHHAWGSMPMLGTSPFEIRNIAAAVEPILNVTDNEGAKEFEAILNSVTLSRGERMKKLKEWAEKQGGKTLEVFNEQMKKWTKQKMEWDSQVAKRMRTLSIPARELIKRRMEIDNDETINEFQSALEIDALMGKADYHVYNEVYDWYKRLVTARKPRVESEDLTRTCTVLLQLLQNPAMHEQRRISFEEAKFIPIDERALSALDEIAKNENLTKNELKRQITAWVRKQRRARRPTAYLSQ
uniref:SXP/RAL-2 family protein Ani s 5-like cation-binding domain-containing protein n=1 Tax=Parascaris univalens TaxID=6257 RepID=A0A915BP25_PARUN